jgi:hypothetical protein
MDEDNDMDLDTSTNEKLTLSDENIELLAKYISFTPEPRKSCLTTVELVFCLIVVVLYICLNL